MLQILLGADDHTASEGAYSRAVKARKWVYLAAALGALLAHGFYDEEAANSLLKVIDLPAWLLTQAVGFGLLYLTVQYGLLLEQLRSVYDLELSERFAQKLLAERTAAQSAIEGAASSLATVDREVSMLNAREAEYDRGISSGQPFSTTEQDALRSQFRAAMSNRVLANQNLEAAKVRASSIDERDPAKRVRFVFIEKMIDLLRLAPPILVGTVVLISLLVSQF